MRKFAEGTTVSVERSRAETDDDGWKHHTPRGTFPIKLPLEVWPWREAKKRFIDRYTELTGAEFTMLPAGARGVEWVEPVDPYWLPKTDDPSKPFELPELTRTPVPTKLIMRNRDGTSVVEFKRPPKPTP